MGAQTVLNYVSALFGVISAICWVASAIAQARSSDPNPGPRTLGFAMRDGTFNEENVIVRTMRLQSDWNRKAAFTAAVAALLQAGSIVVAGSTQTKNVAPVTACVVTLEKDGRLIMTLPSGMPLKEPNKIKCSLGASVK